MNMSEYKMPNGNKYMIVEDVAIVWNYCKVTKQDYVLKVNARKFIECFDGDVDRIFPELSVYNRIFLKTGFTPKEQVQGLGHKPQEVFHTDALENVESLVRHALKSIMDASTFVMAVYNNSSEFDVKYKNEFQPLTVADTGSHNHITGYLRANTPYFVLSEECPDKYKQKITEHESFWLVDPLDGTKEFIKKNGEFAMLVSFIHKGKPIIGVMYFPVTDTVYFANLVHGCAYKIKNFVKDARLFGFQDVLKSWVTVKIKHEYQNPLILLTSRSHREPEMDDYINGLKQKGFDVVEQGFGSAVKFAKILENDADVYARIVSKDRGPCQWDIAAAHCIIKVAGGEVLNMETREELTYGMAEMKVPSFIIKHPKLKI